MNATDRKSIGRRIRAQRELLGYTREKLAEELEVSPKFCSDIELGVRGMSIHTLVRLSGILNLTTDYILFGTTPDCESADMSTLLKLVEKCPQDQQKNLSSIIHTFLNAVSE